MKIPRSLLQQIHAHLEAGYPREACGVLLGKDRLVTEFVAAGNSQTDSPQNRYSIDPLFYRQIERDADRRGLALIGICHSHPDAAASPSKFDRDHAWPMLSYLIVTVRAGQACDSRSWLLREDDSGFTEEQVDILD